MTLPTQINTHSDDAVNRLTDQFLNQPNIEGLIRSFVNQYQEIEDAAFQIIEGTFLDDAEGAQLDRLGKIVGARRQGRSDEDYFNYIIAKIGQNTSHGTKEELISIFNLLTSSPTSYYSNLGNGVCSIMASIDISSLNTEDIRTFCQEVLCVGVRLDTIGWYNDTDAFGFFENPDALGFGDLSDPLVGGELASLV